MEEYRKTIKKRIQIAIVFDIVALILVVCDQNGVFGVHQETGLVSNLFNIQLGILFGLAILASIYIIKISSLLRDEHMLQLAYHKENDERKQLIMQKSGGNVIVICALLILVAGFIGGYYDGMIFLTTLVCAYFLLFVKFGLKLYYKRKY